MISKEIKLTHKNKEFRSELTKYDIEDIKQTLEKK